METRNVVPGEQVRRPSALLTVPSSNPGPGQDWLKPAFRGTAFPRGLVTRSFYFSSTLEMVGLLYPGSECTLLASWGLAFWSPYLSPYLVLLCDSSHQTYLQNRWDVNSAANSSLSVVLL